MEFCPRQVSFTIAGSPGVLVTATENAGSIDFTLDVLDSTKLTGDLRGLFFQFNEAKLAGLQVVDTDHLITGFKASANSVIDLGNGDNMLAAATPFDVGVGFGTAGIGKGDDLSQPVHFTLTDTAHDLTLDDMAHMQFGARVTSIGDPAKPQIRNGSEKIVTNAPAAPDAKDDAYSVHEDGVTTPSTTTHAVQLNVLANDVDADGKALTITEVHLGDHPHGTVSIAADGKSLLYTPDHDYAGTNTDPNSVDDSFQYCVSDGSGGEDHATVNIHLVPVADTPQVTFQVVDPQAGDPVGEVRLHITAATTDVDGSETISGFTLGSLPAGVTLSSGTVSHTLVGGLDTASQDVQLFLPDNQTSNFDFHVTAISAENGVGDPDTATADASKHIELDFAHTVTPESFHTENQSIWDPSIPAGFDDNRFIGVNVSGDPDETFIVPGIPPTVVDAEVNYHVKLGFQSHLHVDLGVASADLNFDVTLDTAYNKTTDTLQITPSEKLTGGTLHTTGPEGSYNLDFVVDVGFHPDLSVDGLDVGDIFGDIFDVNFADTENLLNLSSHDPSLPFTVPLPAGLSITFDWPHISTSGGQTGADELTATGASNNFLELGLDVDQLAAEIFPLLAPITTPDDAHDFEWLDVDLNGGINLLQTFDLKAHGLAGTLKFEDGSTHAFDFSTPFLIHNASSLDLDHNGINFDLALSPLASLRNQTDLGFNVGYSLDVLKNIPVVDDTLYHTDGSANVASLSLYDHTFDLQGFNTQHIAFGA
jgi:hypothetical protein